MICKNCGAEIRDDARFCTECGAKIDPNNVAPTDPAVQPDYEPAQTNEQPVIPVQQADAEGKTESVAAPGSTTVGEPAKKAKKEKVKKEKKERKPINKKLIAAIAAVVVVGGIVAACILSNTYMSPVNARQRMLNSSHVNYERMVRKINGNLAASQIKSVEKILHNSDDYCTELDELNEYFNDQHDEILDKFGSNATVKYYVVEKVPLSEKQLRSYRYDIQDVVNEVQYSIDQYDEASSEDWTYLADELDLSRADAKKLVDRLQKLMDKLGRLKVTKGYKLVCRRVVEGKDSKTPETEKVTFTVLKVNGRWVCYDTFGFAFRDVM